MAGGCVRDALLGKPPKDYDIATDATPDAVRKVFGKKRTLAFGASFGVIGVLPSRGGRDRSSRVEPTEVATFRSDGEYSDGRRPDQVHYGNAQDDALRRDFTINGLFYDPSNDEVVDYVDGQADLQRRVLRTIGDPVARFGEDRLRMLRAVRFATTLGFKIAAETQSAIIKHAKEIAVVSGERIGAEMRRVIAHENVAEGLGHLISGELHHKVLPEVSSLRWDEFEALVSQLTPRTFPLALACWLSCVDGSAESLSQLTSRWKLSNDETRVAQSAVSHWGVIAEAHQHPWSLVQPILISRDADAIVSLAVAQVKSRKLSGEGLDLVHAKLRLPDEELNPPMLLTGDDLAVMGIPRGPQYGAILKSLREMQLDGVIASREAAVQVAKQLAE